MRRLGIVTTCVLMLLVFAVSPTLGADGSNLNVGVQDTYADGGTERGGESVPTDTFYLCQGEAIYDTLSFSFDNIDDTAIRLELVDGPGTLTYEVTDKLYGYYTYVPTVDGNFLIQVLMVGPGWDSTYLTYRYDVFIDEPPTLNDQYHYKRFCSTGETRYLKVYASDPESIPLHFELLSGVGTIEATSGWITYVPDTAGVYVFEVSASDSCFADTGFVYDTIEFNTLPTLVTKDTTIYICEPGEVCFDVLFTDIDGDSILVEQAGGPGTTTMIDEVMGQTCFTADGGDSTTYTFYYSLYDNCWSSTKSTRWIVDSLHVTVVINQPPTIYTPDSLVFYTCEPDSFCFTVDGADPELGPLTYSVLSDNATIDGNTVCFAGDSSSQFDIVIEAVDDCGNADTGTVAITVEGNRSPYVQMADDFDVTICVTETICFSATADDPDFDIASIDVNYGIYDAQTGRICFEADTSGQYVIVMTATDSCGVSASDTTVVTVDHPLEPQVFLPDDFSTVLCGVGDVCMDVTITGDSIQNVIPSYPGIYNEETGQLCFTLDTAGVYQLILEATGGCGAMTAADTVRVTVVLPDEPFVDLGADFTVNQCTPEEICVNLSVIDFYQSLDFNFGAYNPATSQVCFTPDSSGTYLLTATVTDSCGFRATDTVVITVTQNNPPVISELPDSSIYLCYPEEICFDAFISDPDNDIAEVTVSRGTWENDKVCFIPLDSGLYNIVLTVTDSCGNTAVDTAHITILTDQGIALDCPGDTTVFTCTAVDTFCFPIEGIPDNAEVTVSGINTWYDAVNQSVCYWSECSNQNRITVTATTPCNTFECSFMVTVVCNTPPLVILPQDTTISSCEAGTVCLPVGISDIDGNLESIQVFGAVFDPVTSTVCFDTDTAGIYQITVSATDSCGAIDSDDILVTIQDNSPPQVSVVAPDSAVEQCEPQEICLPVTIEDIDNNVVSVTSTLGTYDSMTGEMCFTPDDSGEFCGQVIAVDECGLADTADFCVTVATGDFVQIECPTGGPVEVDLCSADSVCVPVNITGSNYTVSTSFGVWDNGSICFLADTSGLYEMTVIGSAACNSDTCTIEVAVTIAEPISITCPADTALMICDADTVCFDYTVSGPVETIDIIGPGYIDSQTVCVPVLQSGEHAITLVASGRCGQDSCSFTVTVTENSAPVVSLGEVEPITQCELAEVCLPVSITDNDNNIVEITSSLGTFTNDSTLCFTPPDFGTYAVVVTAIDACGASDVDTVNVTILAGSVPTIVCPNRTIIDTICGPDTVCVSTPIGPSDAVVTILPAGSYDPITGQSCIPVQQGGIVNVTIIAEATCGADTCQFDINVTQAEPASVSCPDVIDTILCLAETQTLRFPVTVTGTDVDVSVEPSGVYANDSVSMLITEAGTFEVDIIANGYCNVDTCHTTIVVEADQVPVINTPDMLTFIRCLKDTSHICIDGIYATDTESDVTLSMTCGVGEFQMAGADSGQICFLPDSFGVYQFCFEASDGCNTVVDTFTVEVLEEEDCDLCLSLRIQADSCVVVGAQTEAKLYIDTKTAIGGFDLLISYDETALSFNWATIEGTEIDGWEYFTHRLNDGACGQSCPSGLVRLVGIAEMNNGSNHPPVETLTPDGLMIKIGFYVTNDQNLGGQFIPISFVWYECGDNSFSDPTGNDMFVDLRILNPEEVVLWDEADDVNFPSNTRPFGMGIPDVCIQSDPGKPAPIRCIEFINGGICIKHPDSIDDRGDLNLNGIAYEISDAILYTNYFVHGLGVFTINLAGQVAASDVNADGITLSVGDLVYLTRVIVGDADPIPKLSPYETSLILSSVETSDGLAVTTDAISDIGALYMVFDITGDVNVANVLPSVDASKMDILWNIDGEQLKILVYNIGTNFIEPGQRQIVEIPYSGNGTLTLQNSEVVDYHGRPYHVVNKQNSLPSNFTLEQNYPNPFNPSTTIRFSLPYETDWHVSIFNVNGALVREFSGVSSAGVVSLEWDGLTAGGDLAASGVYFYRLETQEYSDTKKMILLK